MSDNIMYLIRLGVLIAAITVIQYLTSLSIGKILVFEMLYRIPLTGLIYLVNALIITALVLSADIYNFFHDHKK